MPVLVNGTETEVPVVAVTQNGLPVIVPVEELKLNKFSTVETIIFAPKGFIRPIITQCINEVSGTTIDYLVFMGQSWNNTADNITEISILSNHADSLAVGSTFELYKLNL